jgi:hypothetical protein
MKMKIMRAPRKQALYDQIEALKQENKRAKDAFKFLGLPDLDDPTFEAKLTHLAFKMGLLKRT